MYLMQLRLEVTKGHLCSYTALGRVIGPCVAFMLYFSCCSVWCDGKQYTLQNLAVLQKEQSGSCILMNVISSVMCYAWMVRQWLMGFDKSYLLILKKELMRYLTWESAGQVSATAFFWPLRPLLCMKYCLSWIFTSWFLLLEQVQR